MKRETIVRAWKDPAFRARLSSEQRASLPDSPSGTPMTELDEAELQEITGGRVGGELGTSTGCTGPVRATCGIHMCPNAQAF